MSFYESNYERPSVENGWDHPSPPLPASAYPDGAAPVDVEYDVEALLTENTLLREALDGARRRERDAFQAVCWVVAAEGRTIVVPVVVMGENWRLSVEDLVDGARRFTTTVADEVLPEGSDQALPFLCLNCGKPMAEHGRMANCYPLASDRTGRSS